MKDVEKTIKKIKALEIQGATAVARATVQAFIDYGRKLKLPPKKFIIEIERMGEELAYARPTEPLAQNALRFILNTFQSGKDPGESLERAGLTFLDLLETSRKRVIQSGINSISKIIYKFKRGRGFEILTHCHSSTVEKIINGVWQKEKNKFRVFATETRPLFQGRITAKNLAKAGIDVTMVTDSAAPFLISEASGKELMMDLVLIGCDAILPDGSCFNKIGSYSIALSANREKVPVYVAANLLKFSAEWTPLEIRSEKEIWPDAPKGLEIINFAFDAVPREFITGYITEFGVIKSEHIYQTVKKQYPWLIK